MSHTPTSMRRAQLCIGMAALLVLAFAALTHARFAHAADASSPSYRLQGAVINSFGGLGGSASYDLVTSGGEAFVGLGSSTTYRFDAGAVAQLQHSISLGVDSGSVGLDGTPLGSSDTAQSTLSVLTDAGGYLLGVAQDHALLHTDAVTTIPAVGGSIATPAAWNEGTTVGLGFSIASGTGVDPKWGTSPNLNFAAFPGSSTTFHAKSGEQSTWDDTVVEYRIAGSPSQKAGSYSNQVTYTAVTLP